MKQKLLAKLAFGLLTACAQPDTNNLPTDLDRSATLEGIDVDANGVRDDIDAYITQNYVADNQRRAALQGARAMQKALLIRPGDRLEAKRGAIELMRAIRCASATFPQSGPNPNSHRVNREIEALTTNTRQRLQAYLEFSKTLDGTSWTLPMGDTCK